MLANDIFIGIVLSLNYLLGFILYSWSKEEVDYILNHFKVFERLDKLVIPLAVLFGIMSAVFIKKIEILLIILLISTIISSGTIKDNLNPQQVQGMEKSRFFHKNKILIPMVSFLIAFVVVYFAVLFLQK